MNGLTAANVDHLTEAIEQSIDRYKAGGKKETVGALEDLLYAINEMKRYNTAQASRPDRVGDECWYASWDLDNGRWDWRRGVLRSWISGDNPAAIEDIQTGWIEYKSNISFATEAPK
jgi:hypothetical protein